MTRMSLMSAFLTLPLECMEFSYQQAYGTPWNAWNQIPFFLKYKKDLLYHTKIVVFSNRTIMKLFYHGTSVLFDRFDLTHILEGDGKIDFGYGVYLTSNKNSAGHYSGSNKSATEHYIYSVLIPKLTEDNHIDFKHSVHPNIIKRAEQKLQESIPYKMTLDSKDFRKFLAKALTGSVDLDGERAAAEFLDSIGVNYICWPYCWRNPNLGTNLAVFNADKIQIVRIEQVELNSKQKLITGSEKTIKEFPYEFIK